jgi:hypothetical protein
MMPLKLPRGAEREYIAVSGIIAVYVASLQSGPALVGFSRDLLHTLLGLRRRWRGLQIDSAFWVPTKREARLITAEVNRCLPHGEQGLLVASAKDATRKVENVAAHMGIALTDHATVLMRTRHAVAYVEDKLAQAQRCGELQQFNRDFRAWRLQARTMGRGMSYVEARARLRRKVFQQILTNEVQIDAKRIFPPLPGIDFSETG